MRKITFFISIVLFALSLEAFAQSTGNFNYQAVIRDNSGELISNQTIGVKIYILETSTSEVGIYSESHAVTTSDLGQIKLLVGNGTDPSGDFSAIDWGAGEKFIKIEIDAGDDFVNMGTFQLFSVPYAHYAFKTENVDDADADITNEIQDLNLTDDILTITNNPTATPIPLSAYTGNNTDEQELTMSGDTLFISNGNNVILPYDSSKWVIDGNTMYYNEGKIGIGSSEPVSNLEVKATSAGSEALFQVINASNDTVFAVYPDGVKIYVNSEAKGKIGGFAVSGRTPSKAGDVDILKVTMDSTRIYVSDTINSKGKIGGFAVSGRTPSKLGAFNDYLVITPDSTRIYVNDTSVVKGKIGGFAVSGRTPSKGTTNDYLRVTRDSTRVYITEDSKGKIGGFAVSGRTPSKGVARKFMDMTKANYFIGHESGQNNTNGLYNSFIGYESGLSNQDGSNNVFLGYNSGYTNSIGDNNTFLGHVAGYSNSSGSNNVFLGDSSGFYNSEGEQNIFLGNGSGKANTGGDYNAFIGFRAGHKNLSGLNNAFIGYQAGYSNETGNNNAFIGYQAGWNTYKGSKNVFIGHQAGYKNQGQIEGPTQDGNNNIYIGDQSAYNNKTGRSNVYIGHGAGLGSDPINEFNPPRFNVYIGYKAGYEEYEGRNNTFIGYEAGYDNNSGSYLTFIGYNAGHSNLSGDNNVYIGYNAGVYNTIGSNNLFLGTSAGFFETGSDKLFIDNQIRTNETTSRTSSLVYGEFNSSASSQLFRINANLEVNGTAKKTTAGDWVAISDRRTKTDITDITNATEMIMNLRPVKFKYTDLWREKHPSIKDQYYYNFIAQEYQKVFPESVMGSGEYIDGDEEEILQLDPYNAQIIAIKAIQELIEENNDLKKQLKEVMDRLEALENK